MARRAPLLLALAAVALAAAAPAPADARKRGRAGEACGKRAAACRSTVAGTMSAGGAASWRVPGLTGVAAPVGAGGPGVPAAPGGSAPPPPPPPPAADPRFLQITTRDSDPEHLQFLLSQTTLKAGSVRIEFNNSFAEDPHDLHAKKLPSGSETVIGGLLQGEVQEYAVTLTAGSWRLFCSLPGHEAKGMAGQVTVTP